MKHEDIWRAIDTLAMMRGMSPSALAKRAGLDATTFNKSKRSQDGRPRWPSTESLVKVLTAVESNLAEFSQLVTGQEARGANQSGRRIPLLGFAQAGDNGFFDDAGFPVGGCWDEISAPVVTDDRAYALEISGDSMEPVFRDGNTVVVSPSSPIRRGDRVVVRTVAGEVLAKQLARRSARRIELRSLNPLHQDRSFDLGEIAWMHRIVWASQ